MLYPLSKVTYLTPIFQGFILVFSYFLPLNVWASPLETKPNLSTNPLSLTSQENADLPEPVVLETSELTVSEETANETAKAPQTDPEFSCLTFTPLKNTIKPKMKKAKILAIIDGILNYNLMLPFQLILMELSQREEKPLVII